MIRCRYCHRCNAAELPPFPGTQPRTVYAYEANADYRGLQLVVESGERESSDTCACGSHFDDDNKVVYLLTKEEQLPNDEGNGV